MSIGSASDARTGVLEALKYACSQDPSVLKVGEQQLKAWENQKGFYTALAVSTLFYTPFGIFIDLTSINEQFLALKVCKVM